MTLIDRLTVPTHNTTFTEDSFKHTLTLKHIMRLLSYTIHIVLTYIQT